MCQIKVAKILAGDDVKLKVPKVIKPSGVYLLSSCSCKHQKQNKNKKETKTKNKEQKTKRQKKKSSHIKYTIYNTSVEIQHIYK